ncbi:hypothetical protein TNCV_2808561 [Trichonephila clavipes]|nr:hypothetical protein TNCV_2808561 [Trichonephila clavipes]
MLTSHRGWRSNPMKIPDQLQRRRALRNCIVKTKTILRNLTCPLGTETNPALNRSVLKTKSYIVWLCVNCVLRRNHKGCDIVLRRMCAHVAKAFSLPHRTAAMAGKAKKKMGYSLIPNFHGDRQLSPEDRESDNGGFFHTEHSFE